MFNFKRQGMILSVALCLSLGAGCATSERFDELLNSWIGNDGRKLEKAGWGRLEKIIPLKNGNSEHVYNLTQDRTKTLPDICLAIFEIEEQTQKIVRVRHEGARCKLARTFF
jgi:hypothetical protein